MGKMSLPSLRSFAPKRLYARSLLIVVLPIFSMQVIVTTVFFDRHWEAVTARLSKGAAAELGLLTKLYIEQGEEAFAYALDPLEISMRYMPEATLPERNRSSPFNPFDRVIRRELEWHLEADYWYDTNSDPGWVEIRVAHGDGALLYRLRRERVLVTNGHLFVLWLVITTCLLGYVAVVFLRNQTRSITRLADAADAFGRGQDAPEYKPSGAIEVRQAGHAFLAMRARIRRHLRQRTEMLAGVSHDLRTPLTRMKLNLALQPENDDTEAMRADVAEMERMLADYLSFASGQEEDGTESVDLSALVRSIALNAARGGRAVGLDVADEFPVQARPTALARALQNLTDNALRHARTVQIGAEASGETAFIHVDDDGDGIPEERRQEALRPFTRLDQARGKADGGTGLGLAIVRDFARAHGGRLILSNSPLGGLRATISLPR